MKLSVALIVKNEQELLSRCLDSVKGFDELIICDTGSEDDTIEIAKKYTDKVFTDYEWNDNFSEARNHAMSKCTGDWILTIDADEYLEEGGIDKIKKAINKEDLCLNVLMKSETGSNDFMFPRLYKNDKKVFWKGAVHNHLSVTSNKPYITTITYGYSPAHKKDPDRAFRILSAEVKRNPTLTRERFYLAREYVYKKDWDKVLEHLNTYLSSPTWGPQMAEAYLIQSQAHWNKKELAKAQESCMNAIKINTNFKEAILYMAKITGPINSKRWKEFAQNADNSNVLFIREKQEKKSDYYDELFRKNGSMSRYDEIHKKVGELVNGNLVLDIGCGTCDVAKYIDNYSGFDFSEYAIKKNRDKLDVWVGDAYDKKNYADKQIYLCLEVLEHLDDLKIIENIPEGKPFIFSVPSFDDPSHLRVFTPDILIERYKDLLQFKKVTYFVWKDKWVENDCFDENTSNIMLVSSIKK